MLEQALAKTVSVDLSPLQRINVVVHLDVADAIITYKSCDYLIQVSSYLRIAEIEQEPRILQHSFAVTQEEPVVRLLREQRLGSGNLGLEPQSRNHSSLPDLI